MPDFSMCKDHECPMRSKCKRYTSFPKPEGQWYAAFKCEKNRKKCKYFWKDVDNG